MGSRASKEGLAWLDSPYASEVALMVGSNATLNTNIPWYRFTDWDVRMIPKHKIYVMLESFFQSEVEGLVPPIILPLNYFTAYDKMKKI
jgi:hypothetical protein